MKATTKARRRIFYNKLTKELFVETKPDSKAFRNQIGNTTIALGTIREHLHRIYIDLSLFPAHIFKNYGSTVYPNIGEIVYITNLLFDDKIFLARIVSNSPNSITVNKIGTDGKISSRLLRLKPDNIIISKPKESYKVISTIKLL